MLIICVYIYKLFHILYIFRFTQLNKLICVMNTIIDAGCCLNGAWRIHFYDIYYLKISTQNRWICISKMMKEKLRLKIFGIQETCQAPYSMLFYQLLSTVLTHAIMYRSTGCRLEYHFHGVRYITTQDIKLVRTTKMRFHTLHYSVCTVDIDYLQWIAVWITILQGVLTHRGWNIVASFVQRVS